MGRILNMNCRSPTIWNLDENGKKSSEENTKKKLSDKSEDPEDNEDEFNPTLAAMESEIKPKVLQTVSQLGIDYNKLIKYQREKLQCVLNSANFSSVKEKSSQKIIKEILTKIKSLQLSPSVLEELVQKHYIENKKIISLEGNLLRLGLDNSISRNEFLKFYVGNEINPNLKNFCFIFNINLYSQSISCIRHCFNLNPSIQYTIHNPI